jgi:hypothetical protein
MRKSLIGLTIVLFVIALDSATAWGQTPVPMSSTYSEDFADIANWTDDFTSGIGANHFGAVAMNAIGTIPDGMKTTVSTAAFATPGVSSGVQRGSLSGNPAGTIVLLATGATDNSSAVAIDLFLDFSASGGYLAGTLSFSWTSVNNSTGNRCGSLRVYTSTDGVTFTELAGAQVLNFTNNSPTSGTITGVQLPASFDNSASARIRFYCFNGTGGSAGSRPKIGVDDISVTNNGTLPVELTSFTALDRSEAVELKWSTATEVNNYGFDVERATNSGSNGLRDWQNVGFVEGHGTTNALHDYSFADNSAIYGTYSYRLKQIDRDGKFHYSAVVAANVGKTPNAMMLGQNHPNPFNPETSIEFAIPATGPVTFKVYNLLGQEIATLVNGNIKAGVLNHVSFKGINLPSGMYFYTLRSGRFVETKKMMVVK